MFQLIVAVISIALVAALAIASIFYGGDAFASSSAKAKLAQLQNTASQIQGAYDLYVTERGTAPTSVVDLVPDYLAGTPTGVYDAVANPWTANNAGLAPNFSSSIWRIGPKANPGQAIGNILNANAMGVWTPISLDLCKVINGTDAAPPNSDTASTTGFGCYRAFSSPPNSLPRLASDSSPVYMFLYRWK